MAATSAILHWITGDGPNVIRLRAAMLDAHRRLADYEARSDAKESVATAAGCCLKNAQGEIDKRDYFIAWDCLHQFDDEMLGVMGDDELAAYWCILRAEAKAKLKGSWREEAADCLAKKAVEGKPVPREVVRGIQQLMTVMAQNKQHKIDVYEHTTLPAVTILLMSAVVVTAAASYLMYTSDPTPARLEWLRSVVLAVASGGLGGILSLTFSTGRMDLGAKIPEMRLGNLMTYMRPFLGAAVAVPVMVLVKDEYVSVKSLKGDVAIFAFCLIAGFSERWFLGLMDRLQGEKTEAKKP